MSSKKLEFVNYTNGKPDQVDLDIVPDKCPICYAHGVPKNVSAIYGDLNGERRLEFIFQCPSHTCQKTYIAEYGEPFTGTYVWRYVTSKPSGFKGKEFNPEIYDVSESFIEIYHQSEQAESEGLQHIAGMGYRKALEFLIKDYLIKFKSQNQNEIENKPLGQCITQNVTDTNIQEVAKRAIWLGNDETHYVRKWANQDIQSLKALIDVTVYWISMEKVQARMLAEMPQP
ncbi:DUF4145 domain-containing protein [Bacillus sp. DE0042]|uniref:DUF4145 domain-containing protein n=1 Tax=Bacillus sp. DE0042 TaxID=2584950 RepID=UPI0011A5E361|nr:DUF4145 domain-containing protein [Bacillus sp. DE0042]